MGSMDEDDDILPPPEESPIPTREMSRVVDLLDDPEKGNAGSDIDELD